MVCTQYIPGKSKMFLRPIRAFSTLPAALVALSLVVGVVSGCATRPDPVTEPEDYAYYVEINDPLEPFNRVVFQFNEALDAMLLTPLAIMYRDLLPPFVQERTHNVLVNLREPVVAANSFLQGNPRQAASSFARFAFNTTAGVGGLVDVAEGMGLPRATADFGQTLAVWGSPEGPYLVLPVLGPSNPRDAVGIATDSLVLDPFGLLNTIVSIDSDFIDILSYSRTGATAVDARARTLAATDELRRTALDYYAAIRSAYRQSREQAIRDALDGEPVTPDYGP
jgi:phospholipid-binding lipoprotein MlaA